MASRRGRGVSAQGSSASTSISETLSRLGMTHEQFQAKQAELLTVLLQNQPFVPQNGNVTRYLPMLESASSGHASAGRSRSSSVSSTSSRATSPAFPRTPSRSNHPELVTPRPRDQMELILEAKNRQKERQRRESTSRSREDERVLSTPSHSTEQPQTPNVPPETPHHYRYYSDRVVGEASSSKRTLDNPLEAETPSRDRGRFKVPAPRYPKTPSRKKVAGRSSCPVTPRSSPPPVVNLVSSPGPMPSDPPDGDHLPFKLPSGPYSQSKPDIPYAAIIGRAILASPNHALALQDIYEYITTVYPFYKRGEVTWMNSVRHALSTMAVFRKVARGRAEGKSLWAIYDCDLPCFDGGGFKKHLCADMNGQPSRPRKRAAEDGGAPRSKRKKSGEEQADSQTVAMPAPVLPPYFPHFATNPHHQSYYQAALQQQQPSADMLFPPLPPSSNYHRVVRAASIPTADNVVDKSTDLPLVADEETKAEVDLIPSSPIQRPPSSSSIPDLVSNFSSSSSPAPSSHLSLYDEDSAQPSPSTEPTPLPRDADFEDAMAAWFRSNTTSNSPAIPTEAAVSDVKGKGKARATPPPKSTQKHARMMASMGPPSSPTPARKRSSTGRRPAASGSPAAATPTTPTLASTDVVDVENVQQPDKEARRSCSTLLHPGLVASAIAAAGNREEEQERPSTPDRPVTPPPPSTPVHSDLPSTPSRLAQLESELFDFSPCKSGGRTQARITLTHPQSPSLFINSRAPLLQMGSVEDFMAADPPPLPTRSPAMPPRTPKKSPFLAGSVYSSRVTSPLGTPSRTSSRNHSKEGDSNLEDDLARWFSSPYGGIPSGTEVGSPSSLSYW
ncbi:hypothetical protein L226DRAFT_569877 [Lentinus tigrinus ALCF2SS1-7]|uniref:Fork-head domain-containing protein n=1 Tax=Lentinus tigrinus ALCF2SS1-6 TaxID=1328759 RepID=A0A5C2SLB5_9APHY|nr:hypothetical protein L227DRAFT_495797 [Lentinus tigrinus ALCF2SS1-6]RPD76641.1 hypothetical protein L226DRAFT_569877 [Lentinus tigrinus ALCF2SS1-7]